MQKQGTKKSSELKNRVQNTKDVKSHEVNLDSNHEIRRLIATKQSQAMFKAISEQHTSASIKMQENISQNSIQMSQQSADNSRNLEENTQRADLTINTNSVLHLNSSLSKQSEVNFSYSKDKGSEEECFVRQS